MNQITVTKCLYSLYVPIWISRILTIFEHEMYTFTDN